MKIKKKPSEARKQYLKNYQQEYRKKNRAKLLLSNQEWRTRNRDHVREYSRNYMRSYALKNSEKVKGYKRDWYQKKKQEV